MKTWNSKVFENRISAKIGTDSKIDTIILKDIQSSAGNIQELFHLLPRFISNQGLSVFILDRLPHGIDIDINALRRMLTS